MTAPTRFRIGNDKRDEPMAMCDRLDSSPARGDGAHCGVLDALVSDGREPAGLNEPEAA